MESIMTIIPWTEMFADSSKGWRANHSEVLPKFFAFCELEMMEEQDNQVKCQFLNQSIL